MGGWMDGKRLGSCFFPDDVNHCAGRLGIILLDFFFGGGGGGGGGFASWGLCIIILLLWDWE